jgi:exportin-2 (importin alpha re-exporter)
MVIHPPSSLLAPVNLLANKHFELRPALMEQLVGLFKEPKAFASTAGADAGTGSGTGMTNIDLEEQAAGYQAAYSKLATAVVQQADAVAYAGNGDVQSYVSGEFTRLFNVQPDVVRTLAGQQQNQSLRSFLLSLGISV